MKTMALVVIWLLACAGGVQAALKSYTFTITNATLAPDGFSRELYLINGLNSGPTIEIDEGDDLQVLVLNNLTVDTTIHWHGLFNKDTPFMDGVPGVTQYPIPPGANFTYIISIRSQYGFYWYHSHFRANYADAIRGTILIHPRADRIRPYEMLARGNKTGVEILRQAEKAAASVMLNDWTHATSAETFELYNRTGAYPSCSDSILANGMGRVICLPQEILQYGTGLGIGVSNSTLADGGDRSIVPLSVRGCTPPDMFNPGYDASSLPVETCQNSSSALLVINANITTGWLALNLVNAGAVSRLAVSLDGHSMYIYAADGLFVKLQEVKVLYLSLGQRYSVMISLDQEPGDYALRYATFPNGDMQQVMIGQSVVSYTATDTNRAHAFPDLEAQYMLLNGTVRPHTPPYLTLDAAKLSPFDASIVPPPLADMTKNLLITQDGMTSWTLANASYREPEVPTLFGEISTGWKADTTLHFPSNKTIDLIMTIDKGGMDQMGHPMHLHGHKFFVLGSGVGTLGYESVAEMPEGMLNLVDPPYRDTATLPAGGWLIVRYVTDNPGAWMFHCHILWHLVSGMALVFIEGENEIPGLLSAANVSLEPPVKNQVGLLGRVMSPLGWFAVLLGAFILAA